MRRALVWCLFALLPWRLWAADAMAWRMTVTPALAAVGQNGPTGSEHPGHPQAAHNATGACAHGSVTLHGSFGAHRVSPADGVAAVSPPVHSAYHPAPTDAGSELAATPVPVDTAAAPPCHDDTTGDIMGHGACTVCDLCHNPPWKTSAWALPPCPVPHAWDLTQWRAPADPAPRPQLKPPIA